MSLYTCFPPHRLHTSRPLARSEALTLISSYLSAATDTAHLQPNALLTESGPISTTSGTNGSLALHNLKRVEAGLRGEHLSADLEFEKLDTEGQEDAEGNFTGERLATTNIVTVSGEGVIDNADMGQEDWQDITEFEREQGITLGEVGERTEAVPEVPEEDIDVPLVRASKSTGDKEARKQKKKERRLKQKREAELKRKFAAEKER